MTAKDVKTERQVNSDGSAIASGQAATLWGLGDWPSLLAASESWNCEQHSELMVYKICALFQSGDVDQAKTLLAAIDLENTDRQFLSKLLISGVFNSLGKAKACNFEHVQAQHYFNESINIALPFAAPATLCQARETTQLAQLGLPTIHPTNTDALFAPDTGEFLQTAAAFFRHEPAFEVALADYYQRAQCFDKAIVHWQQVSSLLEKDTPQPYYERLKDAYRLGKGFPAGTVEQEALKGNIDKHKLLAELHKLLQPEFYFEIGVQTGKSLALAKCEAIGVDPMPLLSVPLGSNAKVITSSSDAFFETQNDILLTKSLDLVFIDGMHLFEYALRDFMNVERLAHSRTVIVVDDIFPCHKDQACRERCTKAWTGDVWKLHKILLEYRPDLKIKTIDAFPTGVMLITGLDKDSKILENNFQEILEQYLKINDVPNDYLNRDGAYSELSLGMFD